MNPLYNALFGTKQGQIPSPAPQADNNSPQNWNALMGQLRANPANILKQMGYNVPENLLGDPHGMVMHLMQSGQVGGDWLQTVLRMLVR